MTDKVQKIKDWIQTRKLCTMDEHMKFYSEAAEGEYHALSNLESFINTLEVKEVDFDAEWERYFEHRGEMATVNVKHLAKYFFELGIKAQKGE